MNQTQTMFNFPDSVDLALRLAEKHKQVSAVEIDSNCVRLVLLRDGRAPVLNNIAPPPPSTATKAQISHEGGGVPQRVISLTQNEQNILSWFENNILIIDTGMLFKSDLSDAMHKAGFPYYSGKGMSSTGRILAIWAAEKSFIIRHLRSGGRGIKRKSYIPGLTLK